MVKETGSGNYAADVCGLSTEIISLEAPEEILQLNQQLENSNLANAASIIWHALKALPEPSNQVNWAGFYVRNGPNELILGPFQGRVACQTISFARGVCGRAARTKETQIVDDVHAVADHIACDSSTKSEIVVPILWQGEVVGVIDIDCGTERGFTEDDQVALERIALLLADGCDWRFTAQ